MALLNNNFLTLNGDSVTGRVPTQLIVYAPTGYQLSQMQSGAVNHAYKLFCDAVRVSKAGFHVQNRVLADGTKIRMESINGVDKVKVWPVGGGSSVEVYRGLCYIPFVGQEAWTRDSYTSHGTGVSYYADKESPYGTSIANPYFYFTQVSGKRVFSSPGRFIKKNKQTGKYKDKIRGVVEGFNGFFPIQYHTTYSADAVGVWRATDNVITAAGPMLLLDNQPIGTTRSTPIGPEFFPVRYGNYVLCLTKYKGVYSLKTEVPKVSTVGRADSSLRYSALGLTYVASPLLPTTPQHTTLVASAPPSPLPNYENLGREYVSVSQDQTKVLFHNGEGKYQLYNVLHDESGLHITAGASSTAEVDLSSPTRIFGRAFKNNAVVDIAAIGTLTLSTVGTLGAGVATNTYTSGGTVSYNLGGFELTDVSSGSVVESMTFSGGFPPAKYLSYNNTTAVTSVTHNVLFTNPHDDVHMYFKEVRTDSVQNVVLESSGLIMSYDTVSTWETTLYVKLGGTVISKQLPAYTHTSNTRNLVTALGSQSGVSSHHPTRSTSIPTEQGQTPLICYRKVGTNNLEAVGYFELKLSYAPSFNVVFFTESGFVDWLDDCGLPAPAAVDMYRRPDCFLVGGPTFKEENK